MSAGVGAAAVITVDDSGGADFTSIQAAVDAASAGDTIEVRTGTYVENVDVNKTLTLIGDGADVVTVRAANTGYNVLEVTADWVNISGFTVTGVANYWRAGIRLIDADHCTIYENNCSDNYYSFGIRLDYSSNNTLARNNCSDNRYGICLVGSNSNTLTENGASSNWYDGIYLDCSSNNTLYHNNLDGNTNNNAYDYGTNQWDSRSEGNYYSDYTGTDSDGDGIGDTPHPIPGGSSVDNYPLMAPYSLPPSDYEGKLLRQTGDFKVYLIEDGKRRHFTSPEALEWNGHSFDDVIEVSEIVINSFEPSSDISITQAIIDKYNALGGAVTFGPPAGTGEQSGYPDNAGVICTYVNFQNGAIEYFTNGDQAGNAYAILNPFFDKWASMGYASSVLGYPISDMSDTQTSSFETQFKYQNFINGTERGALEYNLSSGEVFEIHGAIYATWMGYANSILGLVTSDEREAVPSFKGTTGRVSDFENGHLHWHSSGDHYMITYMTYGDLDELYVSMGGTASWLGFPVMHQEERGGYGYCEFEDGYIEWDAASGKYVAKKCEITDGLVAEWHFDEGTGNVLGDSSGNGNDGTIYGATWTTNGKFDSALQFDGNDYIVIPDSPELSGGAGKNLTVEYWFNTNNQGAYIISKIRDVSYKDWSALIGGFGPGLNFWYENRGYDRRFYSGSTIEEGIWHHGAFTFQRSTYGNNAVLKMYLDGNELPLTPFYQDAVPSNQLYDMPDTSAPVSIGYAGTYYGGGYFNGKIDEIRVFDRVLTAEDIKSEFDRGGADNQIDISELLPEHDSHLGSTSVQFSWRTNLESASDLFIKRQDETSYSHYTGNTDTFHSITVDNLLRNTWYDFYVSSGSKESEVRTIYIDNGIEFTQKSYNFNIERDYSQQATVTVQNTDSEPHNLLVSLNNPYDDLIVGFIGDGSQDQEITLDPGESRDVTLSIFAQDAMLSGYQLQIDLNSIDSNVNDHAVVNLNVRQPNIDFTVTEIGADPYTLTKTMQVTNNGDRITDFSIFAEDGLEDRVLFKPAVIHANVGTGESLTFKLVPLLESDTSIIGFINATGAGHYERTAVDFSQSGDKTLFTSTLSDVTICMGTNSWYCTNRPNIKNTLSIPPGFDSSDVEGAVLAIDFSLPWSESTYRNHNVDISLNGHLVKSLTGIVPNGLYLIPVDPSFLNYGSGGTGVNQIDITTKHLNGGHYVVATNIEFRLKLNQLTTKLFADSQEEADNVVKSLDILCYKCVPKTEIISVEPSPPQLEAIAGQDVTFDVNVNLKNVQDGALEVDIYNGGSLVAKSFRDVTGSPETTETFTMSFEAPDVAGSYEYKILTRFREGASGELIDDSFCDVRQQSSYNIIVTVPVKPQDKTLVKVEGQLEAYWFQNNILYWVTSPEIITKMSGIPGWESVTLFHASVFNPADYEQGPSFITTVPESDGLLIREVGDYKVYLIENGKKRHITYAEVMDLKGYSFDDVIEVSSEISNMFQVGEPIGIEVDLYFNKLTGLVESPHESQFTIGDTIKFITETTAGEDYTVETYVRLTYPDGTTIKYAYHEKSDSDELKFSETERAFYPGTWNTQTKSWNWNEYTFSGDETEGVYTWEFWYKDVTSGNILGKDVQGYEFSITPPDPIDITPPKIILLPVFGTTTDGITYYNSNVYVSGTAFDPSGIKTISVNDQGLWSIPVYGVKVFGSYLNLNEGINEITISAIDNSENNNVGIEKFSINYYPFNVKINFPNEINRFTPEESLNIKGEVSYGTSPFEYKWIIEEFNSVGELQNHAEYTDSTERYIDLPILTSGIYEISLKVIDKNGYTISLEKKQIIISPNEVDSGFSPNPNGYQFENFVSGGYSSYITNRDYDSLLLTTGGYSWDYFRRAYGSDEVGLGVPSERLANWFNRSYTDMSITTGGNCFGMSASSLILYHDSLNSWDLAGLRYTFLGEVINPGKNRPLDFGDVYADTNLNRKYDQGEFIVLDYNDNDNWDPAPRTWGVFPQFISTPKEWVEYYHPLQKSESFAEDYIIFKDPLTVYNELKLRMASKENWKMNPMVIGMEWKGGHAVVPYKIVESDDHKTGTLFIYDNVFPGISDKTIIFDLVSGTARNSDWNENNPINVRAIQYSSFYRDDYEMANFDTVTSLGTSGQAGSLLYTDSVERFLGYYNGEYKDEIPGTSRIIPWGENEGNQFSETYYISDFNLKRELHGINNGMATVTIFRPNTLIMADIQVSSNSVDEINVPPDGSIVEFISGKGTQSLSLMLDRENTAYGRLIRITGSDIEPGNGIKLLWSDDLSKVGIVNKGLPHSYNFYMKQSGLNPNSFNSLRPVTIGENSAVWITPLDWNDIDNNEILIEYDSENDGTIESSEMINTYNITFLPPITTMDQFSLTDGSTLPIKFTVRDRITNEFIYDPTVNVTITNSTGHLITYFTNGTGTGSVRINSTEEQYIANFHTKDYAINVGETYSVTVTFGEPDSLRGYDITYFTLIEGGKGKGN